MQILKIDQIDCEDFGEFFVYKFVNLGPSRFHF